MPVRRRACAVLTEIFLLTSGFLSGWRSGHYSGDARPLSGSGGGSEASGDRSPAAQGRGAGPRAQLHAHGRPVPPVAAIGLPFLLISF